MSLIAFERPNKGTTGMSNLLLKYSIDGIGNRSTTATYQDDTGAYCSTKINGTASEAQVRASIMHHRQRAAL